MLGQGGVTEGNTPGGGRHLSLALKDKATLYSVHAVPQARRHLRADAAPLFPRRRYSAADLRINDRLPVAGKWSGPTGARARTAGVGVRILTRPRARRSEPDQTCSPAASPRKAHPHDVMRRGRPPQRRGCCCSPRCWRARRQPAAQGQTQREAWLWLDAARPARDRAGPGQPRGAPVAADRPNLLKVGAALAQLPPRTGGRQDRHPHLGHVLWTGPQSGWWLDQDVHAQRRDAAAPWPRPHGRTRARRSTSATARSGATCGSTPACPPPAACSCRWPSERPRLRADGDDFFAGPVAWWEDGLFRCRPTAAAGQGERRGRCSSVPPRAGSPDSTPASCC